MFLSADTLTRAGAGLFLSFALLLAAPAQGQEAPPASADSAAALSLTKDEAVQVALQRNLGLRQARLDVRNADAQVQQAWGQVMPQLDVSSNYTRNLKTANPFAGSDVTGLFAGGNASEWVAFNERARTDDNAETEPITFQRFQERQAEARREAGITTAGGGGNPFGVDNEFQSGVTLSQPLFNGSAFSAIQGSQQLKDVNRRAVDRETQMLADQVRQAYYGALLARAQVRVLKQRVERTQATLEEVRSQVKQGVVPKYQQLSTKVELSNVETELVQTRNSAAQALDNLKTTMGLSVDRQVQLTDTLHLPSRTTYAEVSPRRAVRTALERRPDVEQAQLSVELREVEKRTVRAEYLPTVSAVANFNYTGRVPDDRTQVLSDPTDPFSFSKRTNGFFSDSYWNPSMNVGLQLNWNLFNGFQKQARLEQREVAIRRAETSHRQLELQVESQVRQALRNLEAAHQRLSAQRQNVDRAETNYDHTRKRVSEGVSNQLELREASDQLDQSRLNYLQAVHDYLVARSAFETAVGLPIDAPPTHLDFIDE